MTLAPAVSGKLFYLQADPCPLDVVHIAFFLIFAAESQSKVDYVESLLNLYVLEII